MDILTDPAKLAQIASAAVAVASVLSWFIPKHTIVGKFIQGVALNFGKAGK